jgi:hypothetical protein
MSTYNVRFIHRVSPRPSDVMRAELPDGAFADRNTLGAALRAAGVLASGQRVRTFRVEGNRVIVFPHMAGCCVWHSIIIENA